MSNTMNVYCYQSGHIGFTEGAIPAGALPIRFKASEEEQQKIKNFARLAYDNKTMLVPGVPEAQDSFAAYAAFERFVEVLGFPAHAPRSRSRRRSS